VVGWDPRGGDVEGVELAADGPAAVEGADLVLSVNWASAALDAAEYSTGALGSEAIYADLNTAAPQLKRSVAEVIAGTGASFADVALMAPVRGRGVRTPALASGLGAPLFARVMVAFGMPVTLLDSEPGAAAARKLLRSVFVKGMTAALGEALEAGERLGCADWLASDIGRTLDEADGAFAERLLEGSHVHAKRRMDEMHAAAAMLQDLGVEPRMATASEEWLRDLAGKEATR
jgi:3-hydroxyisobutyrate dehydrogenase-like beta-hydroxyacid dehydrogenase